MLAITVPLNGKFSCVVAGKVIGTSKHPDYFEYHYRLQDVKKVCINGLTKFVRVDDQGQVQSILLAEALLAKDAKAAAQPNDSLNDDEIAVVRDAIALVSLPAETGASQVQHESNEAAVPDASGKTTHEEPELMPTAAIQATMSKSKKKPARR
jgi:hypothetical protein